MNPACVDLMLRFFAQSGNGGFAIGVNMQVNPASTTYTLSLFQPASVSTGPDLPGPASRYVPGDAVSMSGLYEAPKPLALVAQLSEATQTALDKINALVSSELVAVRDTYRAQVKEEIDVELPSDFGPWAVRGRARLKLSDETRDIAPMIDRFTMNASIATADAKRWANGTSFLFGEQYIGMSEAELVDYRINAMVDMQMGAIARTFELARSDTFQQYAGQVEVPTALGDPMSEMDMTAMRADLLAKRRDEFNRGELTIRVEVYSSMHAANYEKTYATLDTSGPGLTVTAENAVAFEPDWTMSARDKQTFGRMFENIVLVDGQPMLEEEDKNLWSATGMEFLEKWGDIGLEYLRDART